MLFLKLKNNHKGLTKLENYLLIYSDVAIGKHVTAGIVSCMIIVIIIVVMKKQLKNQIASYKFVNEQILTVRYKTISGYIHW